MSKTQLDQDQDGGVKRSSSALNYMASGTGLARAKTTPQEVDFTALGRTDEDSGKSKSSGKSPAKQNSQSYQERDTVRETSYYSPQFDRAPRGGSNRGRVASSLGRFNAKGQLVSGYGNQSAFTSSDRGRANGRRMTGNRGRGNRSRNRNRSQRSKRSKGSRRSRGRSQGGSRGGSNRGRVASSLGRFNAKGQLVSGYGNESAFTYSDRGRANGRLKTGNRGRGNRSRNRNRSRRSRGRSRGRSQGGSRRRSRGSQKLSGSRNRGRSQGRSGRNRRGRRGRRSRRSFRGSNRGSRSWRSARAPRGSNMTRGSQFRKRNYQPSMAGGFAAQVKQADQSGQGQNAPGFSSPSSASRYDVSSNSRPFSGTTSSSAQKSSSPGTSKTSGSPSTNTTSH